MKKPDLHEPSLPLKPCSARKILLVDDSDFDRESIIRALKGDRTTHYEFQELETAEALEKHAAAFKPDLLILDHDLPALSGLELLKQLVAKRGNLPFAVIMATGAGSEAIAVEAMKLGALDYLVKDQLTPERVREVISRALEKYELQRNLVESRHLLEQSQRRLELALSSSGLGIWEWDIPGNHLYCSIETERLLGYPPGTCSRPLEDFSQRVHPEDLELRMIAVNTAIRTRISHQHEFRISLPDGTIRWLSEGGRATYDFLDNPILMRGTLADITEQKNTEENLKAALVSRDEFLSIASHELKTPLTSLRLQSQIFLRRVKRGDSSVYNKEKFIEIVTHTDRQVSKLNRLVDDMLDISRITSGRLVLEREEMDLCELIQEILQGGMSERFNLAGFPELHVNLPAERITGPWDRLRLEQVISNLLTNSIRYGERKQVEIHVEADSSHVLFSVKDHGMGIPKEDQSKIFDRFERSVNASEVSGLGLGLFISQQIVIAHGGSIWVSSAPGQGSTFFVKIPRDITVQEVGEPLNRVAV
ncbi:MAG: response regulator [Methylotenera sp.]|nr:response regulator [Oligoflexia bacterium]